MNHQPLLHNLITLYIGLRTSESTLVTSGSLCTCDCMLENPFLSARERGVLYIYIYIYAVGVVVWAKFGLSGVIIWSKFGFFCQNTGFSTSFEKCAQNIQVLLSGPSWPFLRSTKLGPDNNTYLDQIITPQYVFVCAFFAKNVLKYLFLQCFLNINQNLAKNGQTKRNLFTFCKTHVIQKNILLQPPS